MLSKSSTDVWSTTIECAGREVALAARVDVTLATEVSVRVAVGPCVGLGLAVRVRVAVGSAVRVVVAVRVAVRVAVATEVRVAVGAGVRVRVGVREGVFVTVRVLLGTAVRVGVREAVATRVRVGVRVGVREGRRVGVRVMVGVLDGGAVREAVPVREGVIVAVRVVTGGCAVSVGVSLLVAVIRVGVTLIVTAGEMLGDAICAATPTAMIGADAVGMRLPCKVSAIAPATADRPTSEANVKKTPSALVFTSTLPRETSTRRDPSPMIQGLTPLPLLHRIRRRRFAAAAESISAGSAPTSTRRPADSVHVTDKLRGSSPPLRQCLRQSNPPAGSAG